ncbi:MAG: ABC transporter permease [Clostridiales Family XIII bacterium]|jgi:ABC-type antimicrobial peptide transport system permease subunit|nr:ABC transporter permease [Clostridiales Family XIII bacterium]
MNGRDIVGLGFRNLLRRKTRTILAITGVVIGISAVVLMLSIGVALQKGTEETVASWGNLHMITVYQSSGGQGVMIRPGGGGVAVESGGQKEAAKLDDKAIVAIEKIPHVTAVSPWEDEYLTFVIGKLRTSMSVVGLSPEMMERFNYALDRGRLLQVGDKNAVVFGSMTPSGFYNPKKTWGANWNSDQTQVDVITDKIMACASWDYGLPPNQQSQDDNKIVYKEYEFKGVGLLANTEDYETAYNVYIPISTLRKISEERAKSEKRQYDKSAGYRQARVYVEDITKIKQISDSIRDMGFQTSSLNDALEMMQKQARTTQMILAGIGAISLLVAALGITNTMIMSIYERTKEIGIMKVIGADLPDIGKLFLVEAAIIGLLGGIAGVGISYLISTLMNTVLRPFLSGILGDMGSEGSMSVIPLWLPLAALGFATLIGVASGYFPARRAMRLSALESIRNE